MGSCKLSNVEILHEIVRSQIQICKSEIMKVSVGSGHVDVSNASGL